MFYYVMLALTCAALRAVRLAAALARRLLLAGDPRKRGSRAGARHQHVPLEDARGRDQRGDDRGGRACSSRSTTTISFRSRSSTSAARSKSSSGRSSAGWERCSGPILGAAVLTVLADGITELLAALGWEFPGVKQVFYGLVLLVVVMFLPHGIWPTLARSSGLQNERAARSTRLSKSFRGLRAVSDASFEVPRGAISALIGPNGAGKTTCFNVIAGVYRPDSGSDRLSTDNLFMGFDRSGLRCRHRDVRFKSLSPSRVERAGQRGRRRASSEAPNVSAAKKHAAEIVENWA
jgi:hypothetical protein